MTSPLVTRGQPQYYRNMAIGDLVMALLAGCVWQDVIPLPTTGPFAMIPAWVWPALTALLLVSAAYAFVRHLRRQAGHRN